PHLRQHTTPMAQQERPIDSPIRLTARLRPNIARPPGSRQPAQLKPTGGNHFKSSSYLAIARAGKFVVRRNKRLGSPKPCLLAQPPAPLQPRCNFCPVPRIKLKRLVIQPVPH